MYILNLWNLIRNLRWNFFRGYDGKSSIEFNLKRIDIPYRSCSAIILIAKIISRRGTTWFVQGSVIKRMMQSAYSWEPLRLVRRSSSGPKTGGGTTFGETTGTEDASKFIMLSSSAPTSYGFTTRNDNLRVAGLSSGGFLPPGAEKK